MVDPKHFGDGKTANTINTGPYCKARQRLPLEQLIEAVKSVGSCSFHKKYPWPRFDLLKLFPYHGDMTTKQRFRNKYRLEIREDDHPPMHAHLVGGSIDVLIDLQTFACQGAFPRGLRDEVMAWVMANRDELTEEWKKWHP